VSRDLGRHKKKELVGRFQNAGRELARSGSPEEVRAARFRHSHSARRTYGVYDIASNVGWGQCWASTTTLRLSRPTPFEAGGSSWGASAIPAPAAPDHRRWRRQQRFAVRLWKIELQKLADELGVPITVCHLPPGTSKWNKIEHRLFSFITGNWRGKPLVSHQVIVQLIAATTTKTGLKVRCELDQTPIRPASRSDADIEAVNLTRHDFHGEWNYTCQPQRRRPEAIAPGRVLSPGRSSSALPCAAHSRCSSHRPPSHPAGIPMPRT